MILDWIKRTPLQPSEHFRYPIFLRTGSEHYYVKIKSATEYTWLVRIDTEYCSTWASGSAETCPDEYFDVEHLIKLCIVIKEQDYMARLVAMINHYTDLQKRL